ncbi:MAG: hypothetical protein LBJ17_03020, partial [Dysgonamonadaceae bacterium]|nr:hypothetical protein [Dysgonamonadaceae bacterium]
MIEKEWLDLKNRFPNIELHEYVVMPNHFHAILEITTPPAAPTADRATTRVAPTNTNDLQPVGATLVVARNNNIVAIANSPHPLQKTEHLLTNTAAISLNNETTGQIHADTLTNAAATSLNSETTEQIIKT